MAAPPPIAPVPGGGHHVFPHWSAPPPQGVKTLSGRSAETLALVALIFQAIAAVFAFLFIVVFLPVTFYAVGYFQGVFTAFWLTVGGVTILLLYVGYAFSYHRIQVGDYEGAGAATLLLGILLLFPTIIPGILYLVAYEKLGAAQRERWWPMMNYGNPYAAPTPYSMATPTPTPMASPPGYPPMCPRCGSPGAYIPLHQRYFCY
ncbi:MAG: hypothetical protein L3K15_06575, partial [Thermoplasmata archaeon]|nr:hypothetical protein [Thermoplasmata archaeon]